MKKTTVESLTIYPDKKRVDISFQSETSMGIPKREQITITLNALDEPVNQIIRRGLKAL